LQPPEIDLEYPIPKENPKQKRPKEGRKIKGVPAEPHPLDRHSGYGYKITKFGVGKGRTINVDDEMHEEIIEKELEN